MREDSVLSRAGDIIWDEVDGRIVICDTTKSVFFELNSSAGLLWHAAEARTFGEIKDYLRMIYPKVDVAVIEADVRNLLTEFLTSGLLVQDNIVRQPDAIMAATSPEPGV